MVKHMLRTNSLLTLHKKSFFFCPESLFAFLLHEDSFTKKMTTPCRWPFCSVQPSWAEFNGTELYFHSNWGMFTVAKCEVIFHDTQYERKPCVCALCSITVTSSGVTTVLELKATAGWGLSHEMPTCSSSFLPLVEIQVNHLIQTSCWTGRPTSFPTSLLEFIPSEEVILFQDLVPFCHWHEPHHPCLCWLAVRARSEGHLNSLWRPLCGDQYDHAPH